VVPGAYAPAGTAANSIISAPAAQEIQKHFRAKDR